MAYATCVPIYASACVSAGQVGTGGGGEDEAVGEEHEVALELGGVQHRPLAAHQHLRQRARVTAQPGRLVRPGMMLPGLSRVDLYGTVSTEQGRFVRCAGKQIRTAIICLTVVPQDHT
eukprot:542066-Rhodomonas_salina.2